MVMISRLIRQKIKKDNMKVIYKDNGFEFYRKNI